MDWYKILGVPEDADRDEIRRAHRRCVRRFHPDNTGERDAIQFREVQQAYEVLSDPPARAEYDRSRSTSVPVHIVSLDQNRVWAEPLSPLGGPCEIRPGSGTHLRRPRVHATAPDDAMEDLFRLIDQFFWRF